MSDGISVMSAAMALAHEMGHGAQHLDGGLDEYIAAKADVSKADATGADAAKVRLFVAQILLEDRNVEDWEKPIANQLGEPTRKNYVSHKGHIRMSNPNHHRHQVRNSRGDGYWVVDHYKIWNKETPSSKKTLKK